MLLRLGILALLSGLSLTSVAAAEPGYYVVTVYDNPGVKTADLRYWTVLLPGFGLVTWPEAGLGWNVNGRWYTEVLASYVGSHERATRLNNIEWQNDVLLTQGQYPFDLAVHTLWLDSQNPAGARSFEFGPVFQTDLDRVQLNANLFFNRSFGSLDKERTQLSYQWQLRYRWQRSLNVGAQGFGELGPWDDWAGRQEQSHRAGPALFGTLRAGPGSLAWQAAYVVGKTFGVHANMFTARLRYDF
jgi:hypothetical protein